MTPPCSDGSRVAILGGGMAAMTAAWVLSHDDGIGEITVYQRGWRLGGKGASSRGVHGRIEEHGLHVWLGYYDNAFRIMRECYAELDRPATAPGCPIQTWDDAFHPAPHISLATPGDRWSEWTAMFAPNDLLPGDPQTGAEMMGPAELVRRSLRLVADYVASLDGPRPERSRGRITLSTKPTPREPADLPVLLNQAIDAVAAVLHEATARSVEVIAGLPGAAHVPVALDLLESLQRRTREAVLRSAPRRRVFELLDLVVTTVRGILADRLLTDRRGFRAINDEEYTDWLRRHGACAETFESPLVRGVYDLVFGYENGNPSRPRVAAGTAVYLGAKLFFDYRGSIFWKMQAGMGDVVFAPLYQVLRSRGVRFEFFHQVEDLVLDPGRRSVEAVRMTRQAELHPDLDAYDPLALYHGVPCFPDRPDPAQVTSRADPATMEQLWGGGGASVELRHGVDFDVVVYGLSVGMVPFTCAQVLDHDERWRAMVDRLGTTATQAFQLWLRDSEASLGWRQPGSTMTGFVKPFDTVAAMSHLLAAEGWEGGDPPESLFYFCSTLDEPPPARSAPPEYPQRQRDRVRTHALAHLEHSVGHVLPGLVDEEGVRWEQLVGGDRRGPDRFDDQFWTANVDPSDRYVLALPGSDRYRLGAAESGLDNLFLTGDWTECGLNAGCIEAAVVSGIRTANAMRGRGPWDGVSGGWDHVGER